MRPTIPLTASTDSSRSWLPVANTTSQLYNPTTNYNYINNPFTISFKPYSGNSPIFCRCPSLPVRSSFIFRDRETALWEWVCSSIKASSMVNSRAGTYTPSPAQQTIITGISHSPHGSHHSAFSAGASPSTNSPTGGSSSLVKIIIAQVYLLLGTIRQDDKDRTKWDQLQKVCN